MNILNKTNRSVLNSTQNGTKPSSEYFCNLGYQFDELDQNGEPVRMSLPGGGFSLDQVISNLRANVPSSNSTGAMTEFKFMRARGGEIADQLEAIAKSIPAGERAVIFMCFQPVPSEDGQGMDALETGFYIEINHLDLNATKMVLEEAEAKFKVRKLYIPGKTNA